MRQVVKSLGLPLILAALGCEARPTIVGIWQYEQEVKNPWDFRSTAVTSFCFEEEGKVIVDCRGRLGYQRVGTWKIIDGHQLHIEFDREDWRGGGGKEQIWQIRELTSERLVLAWSLSDDDLERGLRSLDRVYKRVP